MARLNQIEVRESEVTYTNKRDWSFHPTAHHVRKLLEHFLPRDYILDGSSKFSVSFGPIPPEDRPYFGEKKYYSVSGVTIYYVESFDVPQYMRRPVEQRQAIILDELTAALVEVAQASGSDSEVIRAAAEKVRAAEFAAEIRVSKLCRNSPDGRLRVEVFRRLGPKIGEVWEARVFDRRRTLLGVEPMTSNPSNLDRTTQFSISRWNGSVFEVEYSRLKKVEFALDTAKY